jgi:hypothetical protein
VRLASILFYPVATYLIISLALLGFGIGGTFVALRQIKSNVLTKWVSMACVAFALSMCLAMLAIWFANSISTILLVVMLGLPFVFGGAALSLIFSISSEVVNYIYFADLLGAGLGAVITLFALPVLGGIRLGLFVAGIGVIAAGLFIRAERHNISNGVVLFGIVFAVISLLVNPVAGIIPISRKKLAQFVQLACRSSGNIRLECFSSRVDVVSLPKIP